VVRLAIACDVEYFGRTRAPAATHVLIPSSIARHRRILGEIVDLEPA
jgi:hypothetical protein